MASTWQPQLYQGKHRFVWQLGQGILELLNPQAGERIVDLGCGTGQLTQAIAVCGAQVVGLDADAAMIAEAQRNFPDLTFAVANACTFTVATPVDAIFSNAALHWITDQEAVTTRLVAALKPGGRLVVEFGGKGNVAMLTAAIAAARQTLGYDAVPSPWYFPAIGEYASLLERHGLEVTFASLFDRPTPLDGEMGFVNWVRMFARYAWGDLPPEQQALLFQEAECQARGSLYREGQWWADYRRIRIVAQAGILSAAPLHSL